MKKRIAILLLLMVLSTLFCTGCTVGDSCIKLTEDALTPEAKAVFAALDGERGIMLYSDPQQMSSTKIRMYAVLYGPMGQELSLSRSFMTLKMKVAGEADAGYSVWRIEYNPFWIRRAEFTGPDGKNITMDGYEEASFVVETALQKS